MSCCRYLIDKGARLDAVNNDGELAVDLADGSDMENLLSDTMETQGAILPYRTFSKFKFLFFGSSADAFLPWSLRLFVRESGRFSTDHYETFHTY